MKHDENKTIVEKAERTITICDDIYISSYYNLWSRIHYTIGLNESSIEDNTIVKYVKKIIKMSYNL